VILLLGGLVTPLGEKERTLILLLGKINLIWDI